MVRTLRVGLEPGSSQSSDKGLSLVGTDKQMNRTQADAAARAVLEPGIRIQEEARRKRREQAFIEARRRQVSRFAVAGSGIGAALAYFHFGKE